MPQADSASEIAISSSLSFSDLGGKHKRRYFSSDLWKVAHATYIGVVAHTQMIENESKTFESPDKIHLLKFILDGELRFGPQYFKVSIDGNLLEKRIFGFTHKFSLDSRYIALQEWDSIQLTANYLFLVDLKYKKGARISKVTDAFLLPKYFKDGDIIYDKEYRTEGRVIEYQIKIDSIMNWEKLKKSWVSGLLG